MCALFMFYYFLFLHVHAVLSFVEMTRFLLTRPGNDKLSLISERLSQDPLENYFGMQRARGRRCANPTIKEFLQNAVAIRAQHSLKLNHVRGIAGENNDCLMVPQKLTTPHSPSARDHRAYADIILECVCVFLYVDA